MIKTIVIAYILMEMYCIDIYKNGLDIQNTWSVYFALILARLDFPEIRVWCFFQTVS